MKIDIFRILFKLYLKNKKMSHKKINLDEIQNILIISNTAIGDTLFATPAIKLLKSTYPKKNVIALLNPKNYKLFETNPYIDTILTYNGKWNKFYQILKILKTYSIDITFIMSSNEPQATPLSYCINSKYIIKIPNINNEFNFLHFNQPIAKNYNENTINSRINQLNYINIFEKSYEMELYALPHWYEKINDLFESDNIYIGFQIGASTISRMWFNTHWKQLANYILKDYPNVKIILTGSSNEKKLALELEKMINNINVCNMAGKLNLCEAAGLIDKLDLLITPDTGPLHIAGALKTNTIAISVAGTASSSNPIDTSVEHIFIQKDKICFPCLDKKCKYQKCMLQIEPEEVFYHVKKLLKTICH